MFFAVSTSATQFHLPVFSAICLGIRPVLLCLLNFPIAHLSHYCSSDLGPVLLSAILLFTFIFSLDRILVLRMTSQVTKVNSRYETNVRKNIISI